MYAGISATIALVSSTILAHEFAYSDSDLDSCSGH
jgi:hypothetical protein